MTERRFYVDPARVGPSSLRLDADEARHARKVLRLPAGARITCFDGCGSSWRGTIDSYDAGGATVVDLERLPLSADDAPRIHLAQAIIKGDTMDLVLQKASELGVATITPVTAERSEIPRDPERLSRRLERWRRIAREASKQCERNVLPTVGEPAPVAEALQRTQGPAIAFVARGGRPLAEALGEIGKPEDVSVFVGPEGGWTEAELDAFRYASVPLVRLGSLVLRSETAALAALAVVRYAMEARPSS